jgi:hypothetical protein
MTVAAKWSGVLFLIWPGFIFRNNVVDFDLVTSILAPAASEASLSLYL